MLHGANGYAAKWVCSNVHVGGRTLELAVADLPANPLLDLLRVEAPESDRVQVAMLGAFARSAVYRPGFGCTLIPPGASRHDLAATPQPQPLAAAAAWPPPPAAVDTAAVAAAIAGAFDEDRPEAPKNTRAVVVLYGGALVAERYADGFDAESLLPGWSMTKSVLHSLYGRAVDLGHLEMTQALGHEAWSDERATITYDQLMRMSSSLAFTENYADLASDAVQMLFVQPDAGLVAAKAELLGAPDSVWYYSSGTSNILSRALRDELGQADYWEFAARELFGPAGMPSAIIEADASGVFVASSFGWANARDWARFGQLYLDDGVVNGERLLPEGWAEYGAEPTPAAPRGIYGAHWWLNADAKGEERRWPKLPNDLYLASGFQGQAVVVIPSRGAVIARLGLSQANSSWDLPSFLETVLAALPPEPPPGPGADAPTAIDSSALTESRVE
ncbi:MAG: serine hydrolase [Acidobacteriota bacterium]